MSNELSHLDLFSGIGGFSLDFESEGFRTIGFAETDAFASAVLRKHWPGIPNHGDVRNVPAVRPTVLTGGFPCQPFSVAGQRRGAADHRNQWPAMRDAIDRCWPAWVVCENVPGIIPMALDQILVDLEDLGYAAQSFVFPAGAVALPQVRGERLFVVAASDGQRCDPSHQISDILSASCRAPARQGQWSLRDFRGHSGRVWQAPVSAFDRVDYGLPGELDRVKCLGNAVPPALVKPLARAIRQSLLNL